MTMDVGQILGGHFLLQLSSIALFESFEVSAALILSCILFRVNFLLYLKEKIIVSLVAGVLTVIFTHLFHWSFSIIEIIVLIVQIAMLRKMMSFHIGYMSICILIGYFIKQVFLYGILYFTVFIGLIPSIQYTHVNTAFNISIDFIVFLILVPISIALFFRGIGFLFIEEAIKVDKGVNGFIVLTIFLSVVGLVTFIQYFQVHPSVVYPALGIILYLYAAGLWGIYYRCKKDLLKQSNRIGTDRYSNVEILFKKWDKLKEERSFTCIHGNEHNCIGSNCSIYQQKINFEPHNS